MLSLQVMLVTRKGEDLFHQYVFWLKSPVTSIIIITTSWHQMPFRREAIPAILLERFVSEHSEKWETPARPPHCKPNNSHWQNVEIKNFYNILISAFRIFVVELQIVVRFILFALNLLEMGLDLDWILYVETKLKTKLIEDSSETFKPVRSHNLNCSVSTKTGHEIQGTLCRPPW